MSKCVFNNVREVNYHILGLDPYGDKMYEIDFSEDRVTVTATDRPANVHIIVMMHILYFDFNRDTIKET